MKIRVRALPVTVLLAILVGGAGQTAGAQTDSELHGGWTINSWEAQAGEMGPTPHATATLRRPGGGE